MDEEKVTEGTQNNQPESKGLSIASMVLGIVSLVFFCVWYIAIPCAILAIIFGIMVQKEAQENGKSWFNYGYSFSINFRFSLDIGINRSFIFHNSYFIIKG